MNAEDCVYVDDRETNLVAAERVGMKAILLGSRTESYTGTVVNDFGELVSTLISMK